MAWDRLRWIGVFAAGVALAALYQYQTRYLIGYDGYYHIKAAEILAEHGVLDEFKWAARSLWAERFADKEFLFHVLLIPFTWFGDLAAGAKLATVLLGGAILASFYQVTRLEGARFPLFWTAMLAGSGSFFLYRLTTPRPHLLSILLLLWCVHFLVRGRRWPLLALCFVYSLAYTGALVVFVLALMVSASRFIVEGQRDWKTPLTVFLAIATGMLLHPQFPSNLVFFYVQNLYVLTMAVTRPELEMAAELYPMTGRELIGSTTAMSLPLAAAFFTALVRPRRLEPRTVHLFVVAVGLLVLMLSLRRFAEYGVPMTLLFTACFFGEHLRELSLTPRRRIALASVALILLGVLHVRSYRETVPFLQVDGPVFEEAAGYLASHADEDEIVFTCDWDDAPELLYFNDRNRYLVLMDPNFMYYWDPAYWRRWVDLAQGREAGRTYDLLAEEFRYGVCTEDYVDLRSIVERDPRLAIVQENDKAFVFHVLPGDPSISLDEFLELGR